MHCITKHPDWPSLVSLGASSLILSILISPFVGAPLPRDEFFSFVGQSCCALSALRNRYWNPWFYLVLNQVSNSLRDIFRVISSILYHIGKVTFLILRNQIGTSVPETLSVEYGVSSQLQEWHTWRFFSRTCTIGSMTWCSCMDTSPTNQPLLHDTSCKIFSKKSPPNLLSISVCLGKVTDIFTECK